jgi:hypothetical protein
MAGYNVHNHNLKINIVPKYMETEVIVVSNTGNVSETEYYEDGIVEYLDKTEPIKIINKEFNLTGTEPSEYFVESLNDLNGITANDRNFGDTAYVLDGENKGDIYIINEDMNWVKQQ